MTSFPIQVLLALSFLALVCLPNALAMPLSGHQGRRGAHQAANVILELAASADMDATANTIARRIAKSGSQSAEQVLSTIQRIDLGMGPSRFRALLLPQEHLPSQESLQAHLENQSVVNVVSEVGQLSSRPVQTNASVGLDRIDSRIELDTRFDYPDNAGSGVDVYIIDSGCKADHPDLAGRTTLLGGITGDSDGHGTMVASIAAGTKYGVAKNASIMCIEYGWTTFLPAFQLAFDTMQERKRPSVVNLSAGIDDGYKNATLLPQLQVYERAINAMISYGAPFVAATGNANLDSCYDFPSKVPNVISVGATAPRNDTIAAFSTRGKCTTLFAPGVRLSGANAGNDGEHVGSGTSYSSPLVAGAMAVLMGQGLDRQQATDKLLAMATKGIVKGDLRETPNLHLYLDPELSVKLD